MNSSRVLAITRAATPASLCPDAVRIEAPEGTLDASGGLRVNEAIAALATGERTILITDRELKMPQVGRLFGFADYQRQVAVVSSWGLDEGTGTEAVERRLHNAILHEIGHLDGLRHCSTGTCVMHAAKSPADLDHRGNSACGRCPQRGKWWTSQVARMVAAAVVLAAMVAGTQAVLGRLVPDLDAPYT